MGGEPVVIVSAGDDRFAMPLAVALSSALRHLDPHRDALVFILDDGIDPANKARCIKVISSSNPRAALHWISPDMGAFAKLRSAPWNTRATFLRLLIPEVLPEHLDRCIYIDSDVVVQRDLSELWSMDFGEYALFAVQNFSTPTLAMALPKVIHLIDAHGDAPYFMAGVLMMSVSRWRRDRITQRAVDFLIAHQDKVRFADQDALNAVIAGRWGVLDPVWNVPVGRGSALFADPLRSLDALGQLDEAELRQLRRAELLARAAAGRWGVLDPVWNFQLRSLQALGHRLDEAEERQLRRAELLARAAILHYNGPRKPWHWVYRGYAEHAFHRALLVSGWFGPFAGPLWVAAHATNNWRRNRRERRLLASGDRVAAEITKLVPSGGAFVLVDERWLAPEAIPDRRAIPFLERDGQYWGPPADDDTAIRELERLRRAGAGHIVFTWPAFWWLDYYAGFHNHLRASFPCLLENERVAVFKLGSRH
jgi:lipopolysaccharide biosynthesis glycosyltransferase